MSDTITIPQLAKQLNISTQALHQRLRRGTLKADKIDGVWQVSQEESQRLIEDSQDVEDKVDKVCSECELVKEQNEYLKKRIDWLEGQVEKQSMQTERTTILLAAELQERLKALPSPFNWVKRLFNRQTT